MAEQQWTTANVPIWATVLMMVLGFFWILGTFDGSNDKTSRKSEPTSQYVETLRGTDDGNDWLAASYGARMALCHDLAKRLGRFNNNYRDAQWFYDFLQSALQGADRYLKRETIGEIVAMGVVMDGA